MKCVGRLFFCLLFVSCTCGSPNRPLSDKPAEPTAANSSKAASLEYIELITGGATSDEPLPMVIGIHGLGDSPEGFRELYEGLNLKARVILPRAPKPHFGGYSWFDIELPMSSSAEEIAPGIVYASDLVANLISRLSKTRPTVGKPVITGFSQGGVISFAVAARYPSLIAGAIPLSGAIPSSLWPKASDGAFPKVRATHGDEDNLIPIEGARQTVQAFQKAHADARLEEFPGLGHTVDRRMQDFLYAQIRAFTSDEPK